MSKATKLKYVAKEVDDLSVPSDSQWVVKILASKGNNLHEVEDPSGNQYLVSMPTKFRRNIWVKSGDFVLVESIPEGDKVKAEIVKILTRDHQKWYRAQKCWPTEFDEVLKPKSTGDVDEDEDEEQDEDGDLFVNTNRIPQNQKTLTKSGSDSDSESDSS